MLKKTVLIAEDDGITALDLKLSIKRFKINCEIIKTADDLIEKTKLLKPALIIADLNNRDKQAIKDAVQEISKNYHTPFIIISSSLKHKVEEFCKNLSSCSILVKPYESEELLSSIRKYI